MSRLSTACNVVLTAVVLAQGWVLFARGDGLTGASTADRIDAIGAQPTDDPPTDASAALASQLARIDARLAALERVQPAAQPPASGLVAPASPAAASIDPQRAAAADRRLAAMLADSELDQREMQHFQASIAGLPPEEQIAISAAFSRAVNEDRIRLRF
jgi:hypothetical protein